MICLKLPHPLRGRAGVGGFKGYIAAFRRLEILVKDRRISKSDLLCYNGCRMLKQVQHDKFYSRIASPTRGEEILLLFTYANRPKARVGVVSVAKRVPARAHGVENASVRVASVRLLTGPQAEAVTIRVTSRS